MNPKIIVSALLLCFSSSLFAQYEYLGGIYLNPDDYESWSDEWRSRLAKEGVVSFTVFRSSKKAEMQKSKSYAYDKDGYRTAYRQYRKNGKLWSQSLTEYTEDKNFAKHEYYRKGRLRGRTTYKYDDRAKMIESTYSSRDGELVLLKSTFTYDEDGKLMERATFYGKKMKLSTRYVNEYDEENEKRKELRYNGKGKLLSTVTYDCSPVGELQKKEKNVCEKITVNEEGMKQKVTEYLDGKGRMTRRLVTFDKMERPIDGKNYDYKGKITNHWKSVYGNGNLHRERYVYEAKTDALKAKYVYERSESGLLEKMDKYDGKGDHEYSMIYEYELRD